MNFKLGLFLVLFGMFIMSYLSCKKVFDREILINESILRLAPRNVRNVLSPRRNDRRESLPTESNTRRRQPYIPPEGEIRINFKDPKRGIDYDVYGILPANKGWGLKAGSVKGSFYFGIDKKFAFANRWGVIGGFGYRTDYGARGISPDLGISYRIDRGIFQNTEFAASFVPLPFQTLFLGFRINL